MRNITLGKTGITVPQNAFGALPIQRVTFGTAVYLLRAAYEGGMRFFDTARSYTDSEEKVGMAFEGMRDKVYIATKTQARDAETFWEQLETSLKNLRTDYVDLYQLHFVPQCFKPGDGTGVYEALVEAKARGKVRHIGITTHKIDVAEEIVASGLYETLQFPFSYLSTEREIALAESCKTAGMGFIAMKGLAGGLLTNPEACMAFMHQYDVLPIWGVQREEELAQWLSFFEKDAEMTDELRAFIEQDRKELLGDFCRGCGYCMPCTVGIQINQCARISQMVRRAPSADWLNDYWQAEMAKIDNCVDCGICKTRCPYELDTPNLLRKNLEDYRNILAGRTKI
ncbi:MAG: aldo/keto reductase [Firmicutes bacterium]|nr:aldo/keto reductase [Bacillota bacterium]MBR3748668.1 aldo/keto reductase [Bacillota bacterium]MBR6969326.1 aldo/keto reductase [Bacillota bacterium]